MSGNSNSFLSPTEQGAITKSLAEVIAARNMGNIEYYWRCLETLYYSCLGLKNGTAELQQQIDSIFSAKLGIKAQGFDMVSAQNAANRAAHQFKAQNADKVFRIIMLFLRDNNYGETALGAQPLNREKPHFGMPGATAK